LMYYKSSHQKLVINLAIKIYTKVTSTKSLLVIMNEYREVKYSFVVVFEMNIQCAMSLVPGLGFLVKNL
jgi:hypothetical protein